MLWMRDSRATTAGPWRICLSFSASTCFDALDGAEWSCGSCCCLTVDRVRLHNLLEWHNHCYLLTLSSRQVLFFFLSFQTLMPLKGRWQRYLLTKSRNGAKKSLSAFTAFHRQKLLMVDSFSFLIYSLWNAREYPSQFSSQHISLWTFLLFFLF